MPRSSWTAAAYAVALVMAAITSVFLLRIPVQLSDSYTEFMGASSGSLYDVVRGEFQGGPYMRPFRRGLIKVVYDLSGDNFQAAFRGFQCAQLAALLLLVVGALRVRSRDDAAVVPITLALVLGVHTFAGAIVEGLPVNHFLTILICCAAAVNLARARPSIIVDAAAVALMVFSMLTIESGLVVAAIFVSAWVVGYRGVSRWGVAAVVLCVVAYGVGRFVLLDGTTPGLYERSAGFGFRVLSTDELVRRFGANPLPFYLYNVVSAVSSVLFAEPRGGVWGFVYGLVAARPEPWRVVTVVSSTVMSALILTFAARRVRPWLRGSFETDADRMVAMFLAVLPANAVFAFAYEKDAILGPAGLFFALAASAVLRDVVAATGSLRLPRAVLTTAMVVVACGWTVRLVGIHYSLQTRELTVRNEWVYYDDWFRKQHFEEPFTPREVQIRDQLRRQAIRGGSRVRLSGSTIPDRVFDISQ